MLVEEVERLIKERIIVACNLSDLRSIIIGEEEAESKSKEFAPYAKKIEICDFKNCATFLYKIDDEHYIEYYSGIVITAIHNYNLEKIEDLETLSKFEEKYKNNYESNSLVILRSDLRSVDGQEKEKFKNNDFDDLAIKIFLENRQELAKCTLRQQYDKAYLEIQKDTYAKKIFENLKGKKVYLVRISDLQNVVLHKKEYSDDFKYDFRRENRTNLQTLETTNFTLIIENDVELFNEFYSGKKVLIGDSPITKKFLEPQNFNEFEKNYTFLLANPLIAAREMQEYNDGTKCLIRENFGKDSAIKERIEEVNENAATNLDNEYANIQRIDESDACVDNALVKLALRFKEKNTENNN